MRENSRRSGRYLKWHSKHMDLYLPDTEIYWRVSATRMPVLNIGLIGNFRGFYLPLNESIPGKVSGAAHATLLSAQRNYKIRKCVRENKP
jgi:hypothetical protein